MGVLESSRKMTKREQTAYDLGFHEGKNVAIVHGRWVKVNDGVLISSGHHWECSVCNKWVPWEHTGWHYCPHCGSKMDGGNVDE